MRNDDHPAGADSAHTLLETNIALMAELENAFGALQNALFSRNLEGLGQATRKLARCREKLSILSNHANSRRDDSQGNATGPSEETIAELRAAQMRILQLGRVQAALLGRAQRSLATLANILAGSEIIYGQPARDRILPIEDAFKGESRCRI